MTTWASSSPYRAVGIYIGGPAQACAQPNLTAGWVGGRAAEGWSFLPIYVGPQAAIGSLLISADGPTAVQQGRNGRRSTRRPWLPAGRGALQRRRELHLRHLPRPGARLPVRLDLRAAQRRLPLRCLCRRGQRRAGSGRPLHGRLLPVSGRHLVGGLELPPRRLRRGHGPAGAVLLGSRAEGAPVLRWHQRDLRRRHPQRRRQRDGRQLGGDRRSDDARAAAEPRPESDQREHHTDHAGRRQPGRLPEDRFGYRPGDMGQQHPGQPGHLRADAVRRQPGRVPGGRRRALGQRHPGQPGRQARRFRTTATSSSTAPMAPPCGPPRAARAGGGGTSPVTTGSTAP